MPKPEAVSPWQPFQSVTARGRLEGSNVVVQMLPCNVNLSDQMHCGRMKYLDVFPYQMLMGVWHGRNWKTASL